MKRLNILLLASLCLLTACKSTKNLQKTAVPSEISTTAAYTKKVLAASTSAQFLTAKTNLDITTGGKTLSCGGSLKMKRDDVIQLSLTVLGFEVGRMECTPDGVLIVDRVNKQYVRATYSQVSFFAQAGLDFYTLQSLFWNELFVPGSRNAAAAAGRFKLSESGTHTLLSLTDAPKLEYDFLTRTADARIDRVSVFSKNRAEKGLFEWIYGEFAKAAVGHFPRQNADESERRGQGRRCEHGAFQNRGKVGLGDAHHGLEQV